MVWARALTRLPWGRAFAPGTDAGRDGPRIAVIGNCQARGLARALGVLLPRARIALMPMGRLRRHHRSLPALAETLRPFDHVFTQPFAAGLFPDGGAETLLGLLPQARLFPALVFLAFHPDQIYVGDVGLEPRLLPSPLHTYHSGIALFGYLRGLDAARITRLFNEETCTALGYLDLWQLAADDLLGLGRAAGLDIGSDFLRWSRRGAFMHGINHPKLFVLADIAAKLARETGLRPEAAVVEDYLADDLLDDAVWPIYPPVAAAYGLQGSHLFKRRGRAGAPPSLLNLDGFVAESLAVYRDTPRQRLRSHRTDHWDGMPEIRALFDAA